MTPDAYLRMRYASRLDVGEHTRITGGQRSWEGVVETDALPSRRFGSRETPLIVNAFFFPYDCAELDVLGEDSIEAAELKVLLGI
jgi:hypothetical protein